MAKLVGVYHDETDAGQAKPNCLARRQLPLTIESDLTMIMALDDACLACRYVTNPKIILSKSHFKIQYKAQVACVC